MFVCTFFSFDEDRYLHLHQEVHGVVQVALLEGNANGHASIAMNGSTLGETNGCSIAALVNNELAGGSSSNGGNEGLEDDKIELHDERSRL